MTHSDQPIQPLHAIRAVARQCLRSITQYDRRIQILHETEDLRITQQKDEVCLSSYSLFTPAHVKLAEKFGVNSLSVDDDSFGRRRTASFLLDLPHLRRLHIIVRRPLNLSAISQLTTLEHVGIRGRWVMPREITRQTPAIDFTPLTRLRSANLDYTRLFESIFHCPAIESLEFWNDCFRDSIAELDFQHLKNLRDLNLTIWIKLKRLDLTAQKHLTQLRLEALPKLQAGGITFHPQAKVKSLTIGRCGAYRIDWARLGRDLEELGLLGPVRFPLEDILQAPNLQALSTKAIQKFPPLRFLLALKKLRLFDWFATPPGPKFTEEDRAVMQQIRARPAEF